MRPVNLIPSEQRRGASRGSAQSTGYAPYIVLGVLAFAVLGIYLLVSASNQLNDKQAQLKQLDSEAKQSATVTQQTSSSGSVKSIAQAQFDTVSATIDTRFNFERRLRQLSHILPSNVTLTELTASMAPGTGADEAAAGAAPAKEGASSSPTGPGFDMKLCSSKGDWTGVAELITLMRNLDGVVSVKVTDDLTASGSAGDSGGGDSAAGGGGSCGTNDWNYGLAVGFKPEAGAAPPAATAGAAPATATEQAQGAGAKSDQANSAAGSDQSGGG